MSISYVPHVLKKDSCENHLKYLNPNFHVMLLHAGMALQSYFHGIVTPADSCTCLVLDKLIYNNIYIHHLNEVS